MHKLTIHLVFYRLLTSMAPVVSSGVSPSLTVSYPGLGQSSSVQQQLWGVWNKFRVLDQICQGFKAGIAQSFLLDLIDATHHFLVYVSFCLMNVLLLLAFKNHVTLFCHPGMKCNVAVLIVMLKWCVHSRWCRALWLCSKPGQNSGGGYCSCRVHTRHAFILHLWRKTKKEFID